MSTLAQTVESLVDEARTRRPRPDVVVVPRAQRLLLGLVCPGGVGSPGKDTAAADTTIRLVNRLPQGGQAAATCSERPKGERGPRRPRDR